MSPWEKIFTDSCLLHTPPPVTTYLIFPETAGRSLEEMSAIFEQASVWNPYDVVRIEKRTPRRYDEKGRPIGFDDMLGNETGLGGGEVTKEKTTTRAENGSSHGSE